MKKITTAKSAIEHFIKWRQTPLKSDIPSIIYPRQFIGIGPGGVKQQPWPNAEPRRCYNNAYLAPESFKVVSGWIVSPIKIKVGIHTKTNKPIHAWLFTSHFWNAEENGIVMHDGTPFVIPTGANKKLIPYNEKDCLYLLDTEIHHVMQDLSKCGFEVGIPFSYALLETGEVYEMNIDNTTTLGVVDFAKGQIASGWAPMLWSDLVFDGEKFNDEFVEAFSKLLDMRDA